MRTISPERQLAMFLRDAHSMEEQALVQMRMAPALAGPGELKVAFGEHAAETRDHLRLIAARLSACQSGPARPLDLLMIAGGVGFALFAACQPDTPGKLAAHAYSYEHMELAAYEVLAQVARRAGETETAEVAERIARQEQEMAERIAALFDESARAALGRGGSSKEKRLQRHLADAHALEEQAQALLSRACSIGGELLRPVYEEHLKETEEHERMVRERLEARGAAPSTAKDLAMRMGARGWGLFFQLQQSTPAKLAVFAFAFEHLEIAGYEQLRRVAEQAGDDQTAALSRRIVDQERSAAQKIRERLKPIADAVLDS